MKSSTESSCNTVVSLPLVHRNVHEFSDKGQEEQDPSSDSIAFCLVYSSAWSTGILPNNLLRIKNANRTNCPTTHQPVLGGVSE